MQDKGSPVKSGKSNDRILVTPMYSGNRHKPWPSWKVNEVGDGVQEKALSIGVFDWERLEKLAYLEKQDANRPWRGSGDLPSPSNGRGNGSPLVQRKQSPTPDSHRSSSAGDRRSKLLKENRSGRATGSPDARHDREKTKSRDTGSIGIYHKMSRSSDYDSSSLAHKKMSNQLGRPREEEKFDQCEEHCYDCNLHQAIESVQKRRFSFYSAIENSVNEPAAIEVPVTKMKIATTPRRDLSPQRLFAAGLNRLRSSSVREGSSVHRGSYSGPLSSAIDSKREKFTDKSFEPFPVIIAHRSGQDEAKAAAGPARRDLSPHRLLAAGLNRLRSNSARERPSGQQMSQTTTSVHPTEDYAAGNSKGRRSPLRRMFDPLLKPKNRMQFSGPVVSLASHQGSELNSSDRLHIRDELKSAKGPPWSSNAGISPSTIHISEPRCSVRDGSCVTSSTRQAVLELAWKNGLPLLMFSSDNNDILAATIGNRNNTSAQKDYECLYTIFTAHEVKKKGGAWMSQGNKSKKQGLVYNVVGHIRASFLKPAGYFPKSDSEMREFTLFGSELIPTTEKHVSSFNSELAAIVIKAPSDVSSCCRSPENLALSSIVAVLPKGVHGLSSEGEPSPLIERWRSGGSCDCGGWDEGCILSVLTERRDCTDGSTHRIELFTQASEARANKHAFSMGSFGEGVYTVDFRASVASVQAFAICVAILHSRRSTDLSGLQYPAEAQKLQEDAFPDYTEMVSAKTEGEERANYVPEPPPPSPGGRA